MKKRKILYLIPFAALVLSGCTFQEGWEKTTGWLGDNIWTPVKEFFEGLFGGGGNKKQDQEEEGEDDPKPTPTPTPTPTYPDPEGVEVIGSKESPISVSAFRTYVDTYIPFDGIESGKSSTDKEHWYYIEAKVTSNTAFTQYSEIEFLNLCDTEDASLQVTGHFTLVDASLGDYSAKDSLQGKIVVVKGCGCLFNHKTSGKTYQLAKFDNDHKPVVVSVSEPPHVDLDYGTLEDPLTVAEARALLNKEAPSAQTMYVTGVVKNNQAYSTEYKNTNIWITDPDGTDEFELYGCSLPAGFTPAQPAANDPALVGKVVVAHGTGKIYNSTYEFDKGCAIDTIEAGEQKTISSIVSVVGPSEVALNSQIQPSQVTVTVNYEEGGSGKATVSSVVASTNVAGEGFTADVTIEGWNETLHFTYNVSSEESNYGSLENPLGVTEARTLIAADGGTSAQSMYVAGTVKSNKAWDSSHSNVDITITDGVNEFIVFRTATFPSGITKEDITVNSLVGQVVVASGTGVIYNETTYEFQQGCVVEFLGSKNVVSFVSAEGPSGEYNQGATVLPEDVKVIVTFEGGFNGLGKVTAVNAPTTSAGTHTGEATVEGLNNPVEFEYTVSASSSTPLTIVAGENGSECTVNEKAGIKVGTSKLGGSFTITVPAGATSLEVYAAAWNGVSGLSLNITGATTDPSSIALTADSGVSNNSPFTLAGSESSFKFTIGLSGITASTTLTFTTSAAKRCVAWSASYR